MHWAAKYLGKPWQSGCNGPETFDCWGFVRYVQLMHYGRTLPEISIDADNIRAVVNEFTSNHERNMWQKVDNPKDGDCLLLSQSKEPTHVGIWIDADGGGLLHCVKGAGVVFTVPSNIKNMGYNILGAYTCKPR